MKLIAKVAAAIALLGLAFYLGTLIGEGPATPPQDSAVPAQEETPGTPAPAEQIPVDLPEANEQQMIPAHQDMFRPDDEVAA